jgi:hypothetical protein
MGAPSAQPDVPVTDGAALGAGQGEDALGLTDQKAEDLQSIAPYLPVLEFMANQPGGQWFDDMGALALAFGDAPIMGVSLARSGVSRDQANDMAKNLLATGITPYDDEGIAEVPDQSIGEMTGGGV